MHLYVCLILMFPLLYRPVFVMDLSECQHATDLPFFFAADILFRYGEIQMSSYVVITAYFVKM